MNELQQATLNYLTSGDGTTDLRNTALHSLIDRGLLNQGENEDGTRNLIDGFLHAERDAGRFCNDGLSRFREAILGSEPEPVGPRTDEIVVTFRLDLTHNSGDSPETGIANINAITTHLGSMLRLARGVTNNEEPWSIDGYQLDEWNWGVHC